MEKLFNFINGNFVPPNSSKYMDVFEPATGQPYARVSDSNSADVETAYESAQNAFENWSGLSVE